MAPVNYAIRFSGPVISLTARHVQYGVRAGTSASPKLCSVYRRFRSPAALSTQLSISILPPFPLVHGCRDSGLGEFYFPSLDSLLKSPWPKRKI
jgi:hypothetical protein